MITPLDEETRLRTIHMGKKLMYLIGIDEVHKIMRQHGQAERINDIKTNLLLRATLDAFCKRFDEESDSPL